MPFGARSRCLLRQYVGMHDRTKISVFRILRVALACLAAVETVRVVQGKSIYAGRVTPGWLVIWALLLLATPWSASARRSAEASKRASETAP